MTVNERILHARLFKGVSQRELARRIKLLPAFEHKASKVSAAYLSRIEAGDRVPSGSALQLIATALEVDAHWLEHGETRIAIFVGEDFGLDPEEEMGLAMDAYLRSKLEGMFCDGTRWHEVAMEATQALREGVWTPHAEAVGSFIRSPRPGTPSGDNSDTLGGTRSTGERKTEGR